MSIVDVIKQIKNSDNKKAELIRFGVTGTVATMLQYAFYYLFVRFIGIPATFSTIISYGLSFIANFFLSNFFTFHTTPNKKKLLLLQRVI